MIALLAVMLLVGAYFAFGAWSAAAVRVEREQATNDALAKAKQALIAYAVTDNNRPGELPCPDVDDDGLLTLGVDYTGSTCTSLIGRLPWRTLSLPDLRDDSGERLWYALSDDFHANGTVALNSDTAYRSGNTSLRLRTAAGLPAAPDGVAVAMLFGPGAPLQRADGLAQRRGCTVGVNCDADLKCTTTPASNTPKCNAANYLDVALGQDNADLLPAANPGFVAVEPGSTFNDRLLPVYSDDIMWLVQRRAANEYAKHLREHYDAWQNAVAPADTAFNNFKGFYPWAAPLNDPAAKQPGVNNTTNGQLPLSASSVVWSSGSAPLATCSGVGTAQLRCTALIGGFLLVMSGTVANVGTAFVDPPSAANVTSSGAILNPQATWTLNPSTQTLTFTWSAVVSLLTTVTVQAPTASAWTTGSTWLDENHWYENAFYAVSPGYALSGSNTCGGATPCVTVGSTAAQASVLMAGRALPLASPAQAVRPLAAPVAATQLFEGLNATPASLVYERHLQSAAANDLPIVVRP